MIRIEYYVDSSESDTAVKFHGFQINLDGLSTNEQFELDRKAAQKAIERYVDHREKLYSDAPAELNNTNVWLVCCLGRLPAKTLWEEFHVYFLLARLRLLLSETPQPVKCVATVDESVSDALTSICDEFNVEYYPDFQEPNGLNLTNTIESFLIGSENRLQDRFTGAINCLRAWIIFSLFSFLRPIILKLYSVTRTPVDVRFWLHPLEDHLTRLYDTPTDLDSRGYNTGYALYNFHAMARVKFFIMTAIKTVYRTVDPDRPEPVEWYIDPKDFRQSLTEAHQFRAAIRDVGSRAKEQAGSPEYAYIAQQLETVSYEVIIQSLFLEYAIEGFSESITDEVWCVPRGLTKITPRLLSKIGELSDITTVGVSPHFISRTRVGYILTNSVLNGPEGVTMPDLYVVFEPLSAQTLREQEPPLNIAVARDKMGVETYESEDSNAIQNQSLATTSSLISPSNSSQTRVLVLLTLPTDNREIVDAFKSITGDIPDLELVFKPHPLAPHPDGLVDGLQDIDFEVTSPDAPLADLIETCDICIAMYSTAAIPALAQATPVIWAPLRSPNHIRMDLITEVGIRADDPNDLARALEQLIKDESFYKDNAQECVSFAKNKLVPDADDPTLVDLIEDTINRGTDSRKFEYN